MGAGGWRQCVHLCVTPPWSVQMSVVRVAGGAGVGLGLGRPAPQRLCVGHQEPP